MLRLSASVPPMIVPHVTELARHGDRAEPSLDSSGWRMRPGMAHA